MEAAERELQECYTEVGERPILEVIRELDPNEEAAVDDILAEVESIDPGAWSRWHVVGALKWYQDLGLGQFIKGSRGKPSRFKWHYAPASIAKAALSQGELEPLGRLDSVPEEWDFADLLEFVARANKRHVSGIRVRMTIAQAKKALAESQGISEDDVKIQLG